MAGKSRDRNKLEDDVLAKIRIPESPDAVVVYEVDNQKNSGFLLTVEMDGLMAFVPSRNRDKLMVLLVNATMPESYATNSHCHQMPAHYPFIQFEEGDQSPNNKMDPDLVLLGGHSVRFLEWEDLSVVYDSYSGSGRNLKFTGGRRPGSAEPEKEEEAQDFSWVAELEGIAPSFGDVNPACLRIDPPRNLVIARLDLCDGEIGVIGVAQSGVAGSNIIWEFVEDGAPPALYSQALGQRVVWNLWIPDDEVAIRFSRFGGETYEDLILRPDPEAKLDAGEVPRVDITVANLPLEAIVGLKGPSSSMSFGAAAHFAALYRVAMNQLSLRVPQPVGHPGFDKGGGVTAGSTICLGVTYKGSDGV